MTKDVKIYKKVKAIIVDKLGIDEKLITPKSSFKDDLGANSLDTVDIIVQIEKDFNFTIPEDVVYDINTVEESIRYIRKNGKANKKIKRSKLKVKK